MADVFEIMNMKDEEDYESENDWRNDLPSRQTQQKPQQQQQTQQQQHQQSLQQQGQPQQQNNLVERQINSPPNSFKAEMLDEPKTQSDFSAEKFFDIGPAKPMYDNPYSADNIGKIDELIKRKESTDDVAQEIPDILLQPTPTNNVPNMEIISQEESSEVIIPLSEPTPISNNEPSLSFTDDTKPQEALLEGIAKVANPVDSIQLAEELNPSKAITISVEGEDDDLDMGIIVLDEEEETVKEDAYINNQQMQDPYAHLTEPPSQQQYQEQQYYEQPQYQGQSNQQGNVPQQHETNSPKFGDGVFIPEYDTPLGKKYRQKAGLTSNQNIINFSKFLEKETVIGDALVLGVKKIPNKTPPSTRIVWTLQIANGVIIEGTQFNLRDDIEEKELEQLLNSPVKVTGSWSQYMSKKGITVTNIGVTETSVVTDFSNNDDLEHLKNWYYFLLSEVKVEWMRILIDRLMIGDGHLERAMNTPAAYSNHDISKCGLFLHMVKVTMGAYQISKMYPNICVSTIIGTGLTHDIGKPFEMGKTSYTDLGVTSGHIIIGYSIVRDKINELIQEGVEIDKNQAQNFLHCILAHHGKLEWGSPVEPKTREAMVIHLADMIDSRLTNFDETLVGDVKRAKSNMFRTEILDLNN